MEYVWGKNSVYELLKAGRREVKNIHVIDTPQNQSWVKNLKSISNRLPIQFVSSEWFKKKCDHQNHQGIMAEVGPFPYLDSKRFHQIISKSEKLFVLLLDSIQDPHNLGSILRSAHCFGVDLIIIPKDRSADINATVIKSSAGASEAMSVYRVVNLNQAIKDLKKNDFWVYTTSADSKNDLNQFSPPSKMGLILGNEGKGPRTLIQKNADDDLCIKMKNDFDSLNVANAASIFIYMISQKI